MQRAFGLLLLRPIFDPPEQGFHHGPGGRERAVVQGWSSPDGNRQSENVALERCRRYFHASLGDQTKCERLLNLGGICLGRVRYRVCRGAEPLCVISSSPMSGGHRGLMVQRNAAGGLVADSPQDEGCPPIYITAMTQWYNHAWPVAAVLGLFFFGRAGDAEKAEGVHRELPRAMREAEEASRRDPGYSRQPLGPQHRRCIEGNVAVHTSRAPMVCNSNAVAAS